MPHFLVWWRRHPTRAELRAEVELWKRRCERRGEEMREAHARAKAAEKLARQLRREVDRLTEPTGGGDCHKVRFHREAEAAAFGVSIARDTGEPAEAYNAYQCKDCPRSPVTMRRYWHAGHIGGKLSPVKADGEARRWQQHTEARRGGRLLEQRVDPTVLAQLRKIRQSLSPHQDPPTEE